MRMSEFRRHYGAALIQHPRVRVGSTHSTMPRVLTGHDRTAGNGSENSFLGRTIHSPIDDAATSAATARVGRSSLFNTIVAQNLCTRTGVLLVPKDYRLRETRGQTGKFQSGSPAQSNPNAQNSYLTPHSVIPGAGS